MKLFHITKIENKEYIIENGLAPQETTAISTIEREIQKGIYGFTSVEDAENFADINNYEEYTIFEFESDSFIDDPEYDGESKFIITDNNIVAVEVV